MKRKTKEGKRGGESTGKGREGKVGVARKAGAEGEGEGLRHGC